MWRTDHTCFSFVLEVSSREKEANPNNFRKITTIISDMDSSALIIGLLTIADGRQVSICRDFSSIYLLMTSAESACGVVSRLSIPC